MLNTIRRMKLNRCTRLCFLTAIVWVIGIFVGSIAARNVGDDLASQVRGIVALPGSWLGFLIKSFWPILIAFLLARFFGNKYLLLLLLLKAMLLGFSITLFRLVFGSAGWLMVLLVFSCDVLCCWILITYVLLLLCRNVRPQNPTLALCLFVLQLIASFDCFIVSPFTVGLL